MLKSFFIQLLFFSAFFIAACSYDSKKPGNASETNYYSQANSFRMAAEWEPVSGTMITWPLSIPYKLVIELSRDNHLYTLIANDSAKGEALKWYSEWGIDTADNTFIYVPQGLDAWWVRDWGPAAVFSLKAAMQLADGRYIYSTPISELNCRGKLNFIYTTSNNEPLKTEAEDSATRWLADQLDIEILELPFITTGGNVITDGLGTAFSTCIILNENQFDNTSEERFLALNKDLLGIRQYHIISNFERFGIQHIDCLMKLLDEERILVALPPADHDSYPVYERIVRDELKKLKTAYGRPYEIVRIKTNRFVDEELAAYTNSIIINNTVYVPLFRIAEDSFALKTWKELMPGYTIKGFDYNLSEEPMVDKNVKKRYLVNGWRAGDALHCRTRAVWDPEMLFITVKKIEAKVNNQQNNRVHCTIIDYSKKGIKKETTNLFWKQETDTSWNKIPLTPAMNSEHFYADIPFHESGAVIEYYISAASNSGRQEARPRTAPLGAYKFYIQ